MVSNSENEKGTGDPITAFAQQLGILPEEEDDFRWLAEVGLQSPLPSRWTSHADAHTGFMYYIDHDRQISSWENPLVPHLRRVVEIGRAYLKKRSESYFEEQKALLWHQHKHDLDCWHGPFADAEGRSYYVNATLGISSWNDPRVDAQYIFELESGLLATLGEVLPAPVENDSVAAEDAPWKTSSGAEVLSLEESGNGDHATKNKNRLGRGLTETMKKWTQNNKREEHRSVLEQMAQKANMVRNVLKDEEECQRLQFSKRVEVRRRRRVPQAYPSLLLSPLVEGNDASVLSPSAEAPTMIKESAQNSDASPMVTAPFPQLEVSNDSCKDGHERVDMAPQNLLKFETMEAGLIVGTVR